MSPLRSFLRILTVIAAVGFLLKIGLPQIPVLGAIGEALVYALLLSAISGPLIYLWVVKGLASQLSDVSSARAAKAKFRALLDTVAEGAVLVDGDGRIRHINRQTENLFAYERTELINQPVEFLVPERYREAHVGHRQGYMANPQPLPQGIGRELVARRRDGTEFPMELSLSPVETDGEPLVLALVTDISERHKVEEQRLLLSTAVEQSTESILITDAEGTIEYANPAFERITGYSRDEVIGQNPRVLKSGLQDGAFYESMWDTLKSGEVWKSAFVNRRKDGSLYRQEATITSVRDSSGRVTHYVSAGRDTTLETELKEQLEKTRLLGD
jgi:PAS domain S-box-containing protein